VVLFLGAFGVGGLRRFPPSKVPGGDFIETKADLRMVARSLKERWPTSDTQRRKILKRLLEIIDLNDDPKVTVNAIRCMAALDKINLDQQRMLEKLTIEELKTELLNRLTIIQQREQPLGIGSSTPPGK